MAGIRLAATTAEITSGTGAKTLVQIVAPANQRLVVKSWGVFCKGISGVDPPVKVRLLRQSTAGTMSALTPTKLGTQAETIQSSALHTATAEPTSGDVLANREVHPQSGYEKIFPYGEEIMVAGGGRLGIEVTATVSISITAEIVYEE